ncbi:MAG: penicillin-binding protein 1A [Candidatus Rokubacteria bacterium]|nr:penicillin-binding protein 1A [Candidatus Rokubacteria bacterium]
MRDQAARRPLQGWLRRLALVAWITILLGLLKVTASVLWALSVPALSELEAIGPAEGTKLYDQNDQFLVDLQAERGVYVPLSRIPQALKAAIIAVEDSRFYSHFGVDPTGIARAVYQNFRHGGFVEGGSTITQQLAKVLFLTRDKSLDRKLKEGVLALRLEQRYSKDQILEMYLNQVYFGHGVYGVEAAARTYFGKSVTDLSLPQAALLAGLPRAPALYSPFNHPDAARRRRAHVLNRMREGGALKPIEVKRALATDLGLLPPERRGTTGQYFIQYVRGLLAEKYGEDMVFKGGLHVYTALSPHMQALGEQSLREGLEALRSRRGPAPAKRRGQPGSEHPEGALVTIEPATGHIKAMVGGSDFFRSEFNRAVQAKRQPGSAFKPFVYLAALEAGLTPATRIEDSPVIYPVGRNGKPWVPDNYDRMFRGPITLQQGIEESVNIVTVKLQERIGLRRTVEVARRLGIQSPLHEDLSLALGTSDVSLLELTAAYGILANQGVWVPPTPIRYITDARGKLLEENLPQGTAAISPQLAYLITHMLTGVVERGTGIGARALGRPLAAKTGTTNDFSNAWFIGYTPSLVTGVWVGYDRPRSLGKDETGSRVAVPIWVSYMSKVLAAMPREEFPVPEGVMLVPVDLDPAGTCARPVPMAFLRGTEPDSSCGDLFGPLRRLFRFLFSPESRR